MDRRCRGRTVVIEYDMAFTLYVGTAASAPILKVQIAGDAKRNGAVARSAVVVENQIALIDDNMCNAAIAYETRSGYA